GNKISNPPWVKFQSAGWVNFPSAPTITTTEVYVHAADLLKHDEVDGYVEEVLQRVGSRS
ncbi:hypothetical protein, partial [Pseudomonas aeruginosa]|uniref:hypothetical protein n=1 Tax=Pseudomonas aeruginosa TaxID=287 RepID=UPI0025B28594